MVGKEERRITILRSAIEVFSQNGFYKAKVEEIAQNAGVGKGTIYEYFDSKKHLFQEMIKYVMEFHKKNIIKIIEENIGTRKKMLSFFQYHVRIMHTYGDMFQSLANQSDVLSEDMRQWMMNLRIELNKLIENIIEEGIAKGELRQGLDKEIATSSIIGTINQYSLKKLFCERTDYKEINLEAVVDVLMNGFVKSTEKHGDGGSASCEIM